jgi:DNA-binding transcriptional MerR regulator
VSGTGEVAPARPEKSPAAFRTISEVADDLDLPAHVLRFWESKFPQLKPLKRGGGRRYYRPEDILLLRRIRQCLYQDGYTIRGVQKLLGAATEEGGPSRERGDMPSLFPLGAVSDSNGHSSNPPSGQQGEPPAPASPARRRRRRPAKPSAGDAERRAALEEIRRELLEARHQLAELLDRTKPD